MRRWAGCAQLSATLGAGVGLRGAAVATGDGAVLAVAAPMILRTAAADSLPLTVDGVAVRVLPAVVAAAEEPSKAMAPVLTGLVAAL